MADELHQTKQHLIQATSELMDQLPLEDISASLVLERSGASKSSMYHFFEDFSDLLEETFLYRFAVSVQASNKIIKEIVNGSTTKEDFFLALETVTRKSQDRSNSAIRFQRARMLGRSERSERFRESLGKVQQGLTDSITEMIQRAQDKGYITMDFQPRTLAVFIQAYTLGKVVDDITLTPMDDADWDSLITAIGNKVIAAR
jgi:AcrR family transcriptional regulator